MKRIKSYKIGKTKYKNNELTINARVQLFDLKSMIVEETVEYIAKTLRIALDGYIGQK